jgi:hypothetical protein
MAARLGISERWFHRDHYDVTEDQREEAARRGALLIPARVCATMATHRRRTGRLPAPEEVPAIQARRAEAIRARIAARDAATLP